MSNYFIDLFIYDEAVTAYLKIKFKDLVDEEWNVKKFDLDKENTPWSKGTSL